MQDEYQSFLRSQQQEAEDEYQSFLRDQAQTERSPKWYERNTEGRAVGAVHGVGRGITDILASMPKQLGRVAGMIPTPTATIGGVSVDPKLLRGGLEKTGEAIGKFGEWLYPLTPEQERMKTTQAGKVVGSAAAFALGGVGSAMVKAPIWATTALMGALSVGDEMYDDAVAHGVPDDKATLISLIGMGIGTSNAFPLTRAFNRFGRLANVPTGSLVKRLLWNVAVGGTEEAIQETAFEQIWVNVTARKFYDHSRSLLKDVKEAGAYAFLTGGLLNGVGSAISMKLNQPNLQATDKKLLEEALKNIEEAKGFVTTQAGEVEFSEIAHNLIKNAAEKNIDITNQDNIADLAEVAKLEWREKYPDIVSATRPEEFYRLLQREAYKKAGVQPLTPKQEAGQNVLLARQQVMKKLQDGELELTEESAKVADRYRTALERGMAELSETETTPETLQRVVTPTIPSAEGKKRLVAKGKFKKLQNELNKHVDKHLDANGLTPEGTPVARKASLEGKQIIRTGNQITILDESARREVEKNLIDGSGVDVKAKDNASKQTLKDSSRKQAREKTTETFTVPENEMLEIQDLISGYSRADTMSKTMMEDAVMMLYPQYKRNQVQAISMTGTPQASVTSDVRKRKFADAFRHRGEDPPKVVATKLDYTMRLINRSGKTPTPAGLLERLITRGMDESLRKMGPSGKILSDKIMSTLMEARSRAGRWGSRYTRAIKQAQFTEKQWDDTVSLIEGVNEEGRPYTRQNALIDWGPGITARMERFAVEHKAIMDDIWNEANSVIVAAGGKPLDYIDNYWARTWAWEDLEQMKGRWKELENKMISDIANKRGISNYEARKEFNNYYRRNRQFYAPNLTEARTMDMGGYRRTPNSQLDYINAAAQKTEEIRHLGLNYAEAKSLFDKIQAEGGDYEFAEAIFDRQFKRESIDPEKRRTQQAFNVLKNLALMRLAFSSIPNSTQTLLTGFRTSYTDTVKTLAKTAWSHDFRKQMVDYAEESGALGIGSGELGRVAKPVVTAIEKVRGKRANLLRALFDRTMSDFWASELGINSDNPVLRATGFNATERMNRILASNIGRTYLDSLMQRISRGKNVKRNVRELTSLLESSEDDLITPLVEYAKKNRVNNLDTIAQNPDHKLSDIASKAQMRAMLRVAEDSQYGVVGRFKLPYLWNSDFGKLMTQYKSFSYRTTQLLYRELKRSGKDGWSSASHKVFTSFIPYLLMSYPAHFGISRLQELIYGGEFKGDLLDMVEPFFAAGLTSVFTGLLHQSVSPIGTASDVIMPVSVSIPLDVFFSIGQAATGARSPEYAAQEALSAAGLFPEVLSLAGFPVGPLKAPFAVAGPIIAGQMRRERRNRRTGGTFGKF